MYPPVHGQSSGSLQTWRPTLQCPLPRSHALPASGSLIDGDPGSVPPQGLPAGQSGALWAGSPQLGSASSPGSSPLGEAAPDPECPTGGLLLRTGSQITRTTAARGRLGSRGECPLLLLSHQVLSDSLRPHGLQCTGFFPLFPGVFSNSCSLMQFIFHDNLNIVSL